MTMYGISQAGDLLERMQAFLPDQSAAACAAVLRGRVVELDGGLREALACAVQTLAVRLQARRPLSLHEVLDVASSALENNGLNASADPNGRFCDAARTVFEYVFALLSVGSPCH